MYELPEVDAPQVAMGPIYQTVITCLSVTVITRLINYQTPSLTAKPKQAAS